MYCPNCGAQTSADEKFCSTCGSNIQDANQQKNAGEQNQTDSHIPPPPPPPNYPPQGGFQPPPGGFTPPPRVTNPEDNNGCLWGGLSFLFPIVGFILFAMWHKDKPNTAKTCLICAIISSVIGVIQAIFYIPAYLEMINSLGDLESYRILLSCIF